MDREQAIELLPEAYGQALRLEDLGAGMDEIGGALAIESEAVPLLLRVAHEKLARVLGG